MDELKEELAFRIYDPESVILHYYIDTINWFGRKMNFGNTGTITFQNYTSNNTLYVEAANLNDPNGLACKGIHLSVTPFRLITDKPITATVLCSFTFKYKTRADYGYYINEVSSDPYILKFNFNNSNISDEVTIPDAYWPNGSVYEYWSAGEAYLTGVSLIPLI